MKFNKIKVDKLLKINQINCKLKNQKHKKFKIIG